MFKNLTKTIIALSALVLLLAGCGSADPEPAATTPPPNESAVQQPAQEPIGDTSVEEEVAIPQGDNLDERLFGFWVLEGDFPDGFDGFPITKEFYPDGTGRWPDDWREREFTWQVDGDTLTLDIRHPEENTEWTSVLQYGIIGDMLIIIDSGQQDTWHRYGAVPSDDAQEEVSQPPAQMTGAPVDADINYIENLLINNIWTFEGPGGILSGAHYDTLGFPQNRFWDIRFFADGTGELSDFSGEDIAEFDWALIDGAANGRIVLNIFSAWLDPVAIHVGLWYEVSLSTLGVQRTLTLEGDQDRTLETVIITSP